jgi:hypothetical protein
MNPLHLRQSIVPGLYPVYLMRFITNAKQPAKSPPPKMVVAKDTYGLAPPLGCVPSNRSRTPPCTIRTDRVRSAPMPNHQEKDLTAVLVQRSQIHIKRRLSATLAEGSWTVKLTAPFRRRPTIFY